MKSAILPLMLLLAAACGSSKKAKKSEAPTPEVQIGRLEVLYEVLDKETRGRVGFVEKTRYDSGRVLYLVRGLDRGTSLGYVLENNVAYRYVFVGGKRVAEHENLGADTITSGARKVLGYDRPVLLEETSLQALAAELEERRKAAEEPAAAPADEGDSEDE